MLHLDYRMVLPTTEFGLSPNVMLLRGIKVLDIVHFMGPIVKTS